MSQAMEGYQAVLVREMALTLRKRTSDFSGLTQWRFISCCSRSAGNSLPPGDPGIQASSILSSCHVLLLAAESSASSCPGGERVKKACPDQKQHPSLLLTFNQ